MSDEFRMEFPITMLGARGVGKTSMIAAMWNEFDRVCNDPSLELLPDKQTEVELKARLKELKSMASGAARPVLSGEGIEASVEPRDYTLDFLHTGSRARLHVIFRDYPGGWLDQEETKFFRIVNKLVDARIILIAIDVPSLMDSDTRNEAQNRPTDIGAALNRAFKEAPSSKDEEGKPQELERLVLFVLMKGERWLREKQGKEVLKSFDKHFSKAVHQVHHYKSSMAAVVCPIQTLGAVRFVQFNTQGQPIFEKMGDEEYRPVDCDQPLRYSMAFMTRMLEQYADSKTDAARNNLRKRSFFERIKDSTLGIFGIKSAKQQAFDAWLARSTALCNSVSRFSTGCKQDALFRVLHSPEILGVKRTL
jgi:hypothetical protein